MTLTTLSILVVIIVGMITICKFTKTKINDFAKARKHRQDEVFKTCPVGIDIHGKLDLLISSSLSDKRDRIMHIYRHWIRQGYFPIEERENLDELFKDYIALGGNGVIKELVRRLRELPTEKEVC